MKQEKDFEDHLHAVQQLPKWELENDLYDAVIHRIEIRKESQNVRWMAAASVLILLFSGMMIFTGIKKKQEFTELQWKQLSNNYAVNNLNY
ncbi:hypothetical protein V7S76_12310 [Aquirufa sp. ROCK2-A2]